MEHPGFFTAGKEINDLNLDSKALSNTDMDLSRRPKILGTTLSKMKLGISLSEIRSEAEFLVSKWNTAKISTRDLYIKIRFGDSIQYYEIKVFDASFDITI